MNFLIEIKEKCKKYFCIEELNFNNNYKHDIKLVFNDLLTKYEIDKIKQIHFNKLLEKK